ncbi:AAA family ATPase [Kribbella albertanoniae]|uniref:LuxR family transcriptional regulator n=1 Tax=Kribbella albertanoniae TaxID=1266829 RepID=A0A4R4Q7Q2_9ACTN|nr:LuxR family transcriptional regulator [Kribbella albertanoniae]TDC30982.1 LuxR family transcriptional regulator [Kribbella albertanoniae]
MLLERESAIRAVLGAVAEPEGTVVLLTGEAGVGKTSVIQEALGQVGAHVRVLRGACDDMLAPSPLQPMRDAVRGTTGPFALALAAGEDLYEPLIAEFRGARPTILVIEDVHWADDATLDLLRYLARRLSRLELVLVLSFRDGEIDTRHPLRALLGSLTEVPVRRIALEPLSAEAVTELARAAGRDADELYRLTNGNPFYLTEALAGPADAVPLTVVDATLARLHTLDQESIAVVEQLSVIPRPVGFQYIDHILGGRTEALTRAERRGLLQTRSEAISFRHELARRAIEEALPTIRRRALNARLVELILAADYPRKLYPLVHHAVAAGDRETIVEFAPQAAREATAAGSHRQALTHYEALAPYVDQLPAAERAEVLAGYAWELHLAHRFPEAISRCQEAIALFEELADRVSLTEALLQLSRHSYLAGETTTALVATERAFEVAQGNAEVLPHAVGSRGMMLVLTGSPAAAVPLLQQAHILASEAGRTDLIALCLNYLGLAWCDLGQPGGLENLRISIDAAQASGDFEAVARGYTNLTEMLYRARQWDELEQTIKAGLEFTDERGFGSHAYNLQAHRGLLMMRRGDLAVAEQHLRRLIDTVDEPGMLSVLTAAGLGRVLARRGDPEAGHLLADAWAQASKQQSTLGLSHAATAYAEWAWLNDLPEICEEIRAGLGRSLEEPAFRELARYLAVAEAADQGRCVRDQQLESWEETPYEHAVQLALTATREATLEALEILLKLGAAPAAKLVRRRLRELGVHRIPRGAQAKSRNNPAGLTDRQVGVLMLLMDGLTNAEIAAKLVVSVRTVDHHVAAILTRLNARTRREAAARAQDLDLRLIG